MSGEDAWDAADPGPRAAEAAPEDAWDAAAPGGSQPATTSAAPGHSTWRNIGAGLVSGASKIGATILSPFQKAILAEARTSEDPETRALANQAPTTRKDLDTFFKQHADTKSLAFKGGELGAEVAGTAGAGGVLGAGAKALGAAPEVVSALSSGGMSLGGGTTGSVVGNAALRTGAGAAVGGASSGLVDPSTAGTGAALGAATPGAAWLLGLAGKGVGNAVGFGARTALGVTTGVGSDAIGAAYRAGLSGDRTFVENMRGTGDFSSIVDQAKEALSNMRAQRGAEYRAGMAAVSNDKTVLDMAPIQKAVADAQAKFARYHGEVVNENADAAITKVASKVNDWVEKDPSLFHTPEGLDKLKQWVGGEIENAKPGTQTEAALKGIYSQIKSTVAAQAPTYAKTMESYEAASEQLGEITKTLSLGNKASVDTAVRKLQSILRNNVTTNYGARQSALEALEQQGGANIRGAIAGQSMNTWTPRGMVGAIESGGAGLAAYLHHPAAVGALPLASPRLVGEGVYAAGRAAGTAGASLSAMAGRAPSRVVPLIGTQQPTTLSDLYDLRKKVSRNPETTP